MKPRERGRVVFECDDANPGARRSVDEGRGHFAPVAKLQCVFPSRHPVTMAIASVAQLVNLNVGN